MKYLITTLLVQRHTLLNKIKVYIFKKIIFGGEINTRKIINRGWILFSAYKLKKKKKKNVQCQLLHSIQKHYSHWSNHGMQYGALAAYRRQCSLKDPKNHWNKRGILNCLLKQCSNQQQPSLICFIICINLLIKAGHRYDFLSGNHVLEEREMLYSPINSQESPSWSYCGLPACWLYPSRSMDWLWNHLYAGWLAEPAKIQTIFVQLKTGYVNICGDSF